jgi:hypothetical protein
VVVAAVSAVAGAASVAAVHRAAGDKNNNEQAFSRHGITD